MKLLEKTWQNADNTVFPRLTDNKHNKKTMCKTAWIRCPVCGNKPHDEIRADTVLKIFSLKNIGNPVNTGYTGL